MAKKKKSKDEAHQLRLTKRSFYSVLGVCRICGQRIDSKYRRVHLSLVHGIKSREDLSRYFSGNIDQNHRRKLLMAKHDKTLSSGNDSVPHIPCGTKISGGPDAKIIYNPVFTKR